MLNEKLFLFWQQLPIYDENNRLIEVQKSRIDAAEMFHAQGPWCKNILEGVEDSMAFSEPQ